MVRMACEGTLDQQRYGALTGARGVTAALSSRSASTRCTQWAPARLSATTPLITSAIPTPFAAVSGSFSNSIPITVIAAVPAPDQTAYATLTCSRSLSAWASRAKDSR